MKILLISANQLKFPYPVYPLGLDYIANAVIASNHDVKIADMNQISDYDSLKEIIRSFSPDVIGISLRNVDNIDITQPKDFSGSYREITESIRSVSNALIVLGGSGFTIFPSEMIKVLKADYGIISEGEEKFTLLLNAIANKEDASKIPGIITPQIEANSHIPCNQLFKRDFNKTNPHVQFYLNNGGMLNLQTKRGCHFKCIYCTYPHIEGKKLRLIPPEEVAQTALSLQNAGAKYFYITDSLFNSDYQHSIAVAKAFIKSGISIPWGAFFAPSEFPDDFYKIMADAGLKHVEFGTESLSDKMLAAYKKPFRKEDVFKAHKAANDNGLHVAHFFMLGGPGDNDDTLNETLSDIELLDKSVLFIFCGIRIYPNTELFDIAIKQGQITQNQNLLEPVFYKPESVQLTDIICKVETHAKGRQNWVIGSEVKHIEKVLFRMYKKGYSGPLWEKLIRN